MFQTGLAQNVIFFQYVNIVINQIKKLDLALKKSENIWELDIDFKVALAIHALEYSLTYEEDKLRF